MDKELENYLRGSMGDPYASGAGQIGYEIQKQERERAQRQKIGGSTSSGTGNGSMKGFVQLALVLVAIEAYMNFTGYLVSDFQRIVAFIGAVATFGIVHFYWGLIVKIVIAVILIVGGLAVFDAFIGN